MIKLEYPSKIAKTDCINQQNYLIIKGQERNIKILIAEDKAPSNGLFLGEQIIRHNLKIKSVLEIGAGKYAPASFALLADTNNIEIDGIEIDQNDADNLQKVIEINDLENRFSIFTGNLYSPIKTKKYDLICSNIAQMPLRPGQIEHSHDHGGVNGWKYLDKIIQHAGFHLKKNGYLALMVFDFLGISKRNNDNVPCLKERLKKCGFGIINQEYYYRKVRQNGQTYSNIDYILSLYPQMNIFDIVNFKPINKENIKKEQFALKFYFVLAKKLT